MMRGLLRPVVRPTFRSDRWVRVGVLALLATAFLIVAAPAAADVKAAGAALWLLAGPKVTGCSGGAA